MKKKVLFLAVVVICTVISINLNINNNEQTNDITIEALSKANADDGENGRPLGMVGKLYYCWECEGTDCANQCYNE